MPPACRWCCPCTAASDDIQAIAIDTERAVVTLQLQTLLDAGHERIAFASLDSAHRLTTASRQLLLPEVAASLGIEQPPHHVFPEDPEAGGRPAARPSSPQVTQRSARSTTTSRRSCWPGLGRPGSRCRTTSRSSGQGDQVLSALTEPALTTVTIDPDRFAQALIEVVTRRINKLPAPEDLPAPRVSLIRRDSV